jgi:predicted metal-dependent hydrolase
MAQKTVFVPEIGELVLSKRRGATNMRLSINAAGKVRVGMPYWAPYHAGVAFAKSKADWISKNLARHSNRLLEDGDLIGKSHRLQYVFNPNQTNTSTRISQGAITVSSPLDIGSPIVQKRILAAGERALKTEAEKLLPQRLESLARKHGYDYKNVQTRKLIARWGSCSSTKIITLSYYLVQLPWNLIDYVLVHELIHTRHMHHG